MWEGARTEVGRKIQSVSKRYVVFDIETIGLYVEKGHRIVEIGAVAVHVFPSFQQFIGPSTLFWRTFWRTRQDT
jgi:DNA polymerase III alpha subunit (gram-positive type)